MFYRPKAGVAGDVIPFYRDGTYLLFYLRDFRNVREMGEGTPWYLLETKDFVHFKDRGEVIKRGREDEQDLYIFTGSVFEENGINYIFYTGHNPHFPEQGKPQEAVMLTTSTDCAVWTKEKDFMLAAPECYDPHDFRDPFVFFNEKTKEYNMLLAARVRYGPSRRRGCTAIAVSRDLRNWNVKEKPFYNPRMYFTHECPDLFRMGDWWYLVFSEFTEKFETHYRMAKTLEGPFLTPENDTFDNRNFYAAKTVSDGTDRYIIGWNPTNEGDKDFEDAMWGGNIVIHKLVQAADGQLFVTIPQPVKDAYSEPVAWREGYTIGSVVKYRSGWKIGRKDGYSSLDLGELKRKCRISFDVTFYGEIRNFYLFLNSDRENEAAYYAGIDFSMSRLTFDRWPRRRNDQPFMLELERHIAVMPDVRYHLDVIRDGRVLEVYFDGKYAMSARMNDFRDGTFGFAVSYGEADVENLEYRVLPK